MAINFEGHTFHRFDGELNHVHLLVLEMGGFTHHQLEVALKAIKHKDLAKLREVIECDDAVNDLEMRADENIVSVIATRGPVARDLRATVAFSKIVTALEHIGDEAKRMAAIGLGTFDNESSDPSAHMMRDVATMGRLVIATLKEALEVLDQLDADKAEVLAFGQSELDAEFQSCLRRLVTFIMEDHRNLGHIINAVLMIKAIERIGDHARNIAEHVIYMVKGTDVRHRLSTSRPEAVPSAPPSADDSDET